MLATRRPAARGPALTRRGVARGALMGVGLLVAAGASAPAALADDAPSTDVPPLQGDDGSVATPTATLSPAPAAPVAKTQALTGYFGLGKASSERFTVAPSGDVPPGLDLSGATFTVSSNGSPVAVCTTDTSGACTLGVASGPSVTTGSTLSLPPASYDVVQTQASTGLLPAPGATWNLNLCSGTPTPFGFFPCMPGSASVPNDSLFRQHLTATVVGAGASDGTGAGAPLAGAVYALAGPDYPRTPAVPGDDGIYAGGTATSGADGVLAFHGWFRPGTWTLTPSTAAAGHVLGAAATVEVPATVPDGTDTVVGPTLTLAETTGETPAGPTGDTPGGSTGDSGSGSEGSGPSSAPAPPPVVQPPAVSPPVVQPPAVTAPPASAPAPQRPAAVLVLPPTPTTAAPSPVPSRLPSAASDPTQPPAEILTAPDAAPPVPSPRLTTTSVSFVEAGAIGFGILFVALVVLGIGVVRRRARAHR